MSALPPKADMCTALAHVRFGPIADIDLFDDRVSAKEESFWNFKSKCLRCSQIDDEFERSRLFDRKISRLGALENFVDSFARTPKLVRIVRSVRHKLWAAAHPRQAY